MAKKREVELKLLEKDGTFKPEKEAFEYIVDKFKKSGKRNYDFLVRSSKNFQNISLSLLVRYWKKKSSQIVLRRQHFI